MLSYLALVLATIVALTAVLGWLAVRLKEAETERLKVNFELRRLRFAEKQFATMTRQMPVSDVRFVGGNFTGHRRGRGNDDGSN